MEHRSVIDTPPAFKPFLKLVIIVAAFLTDYPLVWGLLFTLAFWDLTLDMRTAALVAYPEIKLEGMDAETVWATRSRRCSHAIQMALNAFISNIAFYSFLAVMCLLAGFVLTSLCATNNIEPCPNPLLRVRLVAVRATVFVAIMVVYIVRDLYIRRWRRLDRLHTTWRALIFFAAGTFIVIPEVVRLFWAAFKILGIAYVVGVIYLIYIIKRALDENHQSFYSMSLDADDRAQLRREYTQRLDRILMTVFGRPEEELPTGKREKVHILTNMETFFVAGTIAIVALLALVLLFGWYRPGGEKDPPHIARQLELCLGATEATIRARCVYDVARDKQDVDLCNRLPSQEEYELCYRLMWRDRVDRLNYR
ncbi:MAG: hypothetical protein QF415_09590 [Candidatus Undinarchaeales archaeon]|jgi:hypothetical protein|nr:hypothetical protein [Candidatus Undinarchaeales archaeon]MDP7493730.1 hypothetical protein [Candidatus Undinarchaeales archaeon]